jgi:peptidoglycan/LPS O-acetylase OafA/YrhL
MKKWLIGLLLGGFLGIFDGLSSLVSAPSDPDVKAGIVMIVVGSTFKGFVTGVLIGFFSQKVKSLPLGILFGLAIGAFFAFLIAYMQYAQLGKNYFLEIMIPGALLGVIVGYATQKYGRPSPATT